MIKWRLSRLLIATLLKTVHRSGRCLTEMLGVDMVVTLPCIWGDTHDVVYPKGDDHEVTLHNDGTIAKHVDSVKYFDQDSDPWYNGPKFY